MRYSKLVGRTKHEVPHDTNCKNAELLTKAGYIDKLAAGIYSFLPLGIRVLQKINAIIREEMNAVGGQEILMPALHPIPSYGFSIPGYWTAPASPAPR